MSDTATIRRRVALWCGCYALVVILAGCVAFATAERDLEIAGVWLAVLTVPGSLLVALLPATLITGTAYWATLTLVGLIQAWLVWRLLIRMLARR